MTGVDLVSALTTMAGVCTSCLEKHHQGCIDTKTCMCSCNPRPKVEAKIKSARPDGEDYQTKARRLVFEYAKSRLEKTDSHVTFTLDDVYIVWFAKTLQSWKSLLSTTLPDGMYYEVTYNGIEREAYIDAYKKFDNVCVPDEDAVG